MIGIFRQQRDLSLADIGLIDAGIGANKTMMSFHNQRPAAASNHSPALAENHFDQRRLLVQFPSQLARARRRLHLARSTNSAFGFGDDFLRDHQHIIVRNSMPSLRAGRRRLVGRRSRRCQSQPIPSRPNQLQPLHKPPERACQSAPCCAKSSRATRVECCRAIVGKRSRSRSSARRYPARYARFHSSAAATLCAVTWPNER